MTPEEAEQLRPGDRVFIEAKVDQDDTGRTMFGDGDLLVSFDGGRGRSKHMILVNTYGVIVAPEDIRKKLEPAMRRKFKALDIVFASGLYWIVGMDERDDGSVVVGMAGSMRRYKHKDLELICAAEDRVDRRGGGGMSCKTSWAVTLTEEEIRLIRRALYEKIKSTTKDIYPEAYSSTFCDDLYGLCCELEKYTTLLKRFGENIDEKGGKE